MEIQGDGIGNCEGYESSTVWFDDPVWYGIWGNGNCKEWSLSFWPVYESGV